MRQDYNENNFYESFFKIDCPDAENANVYFDFEITQKNWEWEQTQHMFHDNCSPSDTETQLTYSVDEGNDTSTFVFRLSVQSAQTRGGFIGPINGGGYINYRVTTGRISDSCSVD